MKNNANIMQTDDVSKENGVSNSININHFMKILSETVNCFDSEVGKLKVVDLVSDIVLEKSTRKRSKLVIKQSYESSQKENHSGQNVYKLLDKLIQNGFFKEHKTIIDIVSHCNKIMSSNFKSSDFSGYLLRRCGSGVLTREINSKGLFEYKNK